MVIKECLQTPVREHCDVLVCGGGFAGISAALAAARQICDLRKNNVVLHESDLG